MTTSYQGRSPSKTDAPLRACMAACAYILTWERAAAAAREDLHMVKRVRHGEGRLTDHRPRIHDAAWLVCD